MDLNHKVLLLDIYGELLSDTQRKTLDMRCNADMSLSEIAEEMGGITRQSVAYTIKAGEKHLVELEDKLHLAERFNTLSEKLENAASLLSEISRDYPDDIRFREVCELLSFTKREL